MRFWNKFIDILDLAQRLVERELVQTTRLQPATRIKPRPKVKKGHVENDTEYKIFEGPPIVFQSLASSSSSLSFVSFSCLTEDRDLMTPCHQAIILTRHVIGNCHNRRSKAGNLGFLLIEQKLVASGSLASRTITDLA